MSAPDAAWPTAITQIAPNSVRVRGVDIAQAMGRLSFGGMVHLLLTGEVPDAATAALLDAILVSSVDHGVTPPSCQAARLVASTGGSLSASVAAGLLAINQHHGGAVQGCAEALDLVVERARFGQTLEDAATGVIEELKAQGRRFPGFGHRIHTADPRTVRLLELAEAAGLTETVEPEPTRIQAARAVEKAFKAMGKELPLNVDGAIAAILADLGYERGVMNGLFLIARAAGLVAHVHEEQTRMRPMRRIDPREHVYDGPAARSLDEGGPSQQGAAP